jgi:hypothetical protein
MATLINKSFPSEREGQNLLKNVQQALTHLSGVGDPNSGVYLSAPFKLDAARDDLVKDYKTVWGRCTIKFDPEQAGAEMIDATNMRIGPFFLRGGVTVMDLEKVILHEYLHVALVPSGVSGETGYEYDHTRINQIIRDNLKYPGPPNPVNPSED